MNITAGSSHSYDDEESRDSTEYVRGHSVEDSLSYRLILEEKEKRGEETYGWLITMLETSFKYFKDKELSKVIAELSDMMEKLCYQDLEYNENKAMFEMFCRSQPIKKTPVDFDYKVEFENYKKAEWKLERQAAKRHPKYKKFCDRLNELEKSRQQSQTDAIAVD